MRASHRIRTLPAGLPGNHQPGFSRNAVKWLIRTGVLGKTGATGTDTFGPDPLPMQGSCPPGSSFAGTA